ncbi:MAG: DUF6206 family protein [Actinomycetia bacterium]|nr:DUF6206 family protein [Actinomycetes bacterium]
MIDQAVLERLEADAEASLSGNTGIALDVLGYGEISTVLRAEGLDGPVAAKRLPAMTGEQLSEYKEILARYLDDLRARGIRPVDSEVFSVGSDPYTPYCVQPLLPLLLVDELRTADRETVDYRVEQLVGIVVGAVDGWLGLDGQISNWGVDGDELLYVDVTTPLLRDASGKDQLDTDLFIASLPWALQGSVRRFLLDEILSHYYDPRAVLLDMAGNLVKERLFQVMEPLLRATNQVLSPPITTDEAMRYYRTDARMWELLQRLRQADRWWQKTARHRVYPFLLPGEIER